MIKKLADEKKLVVILTICFLINSFESELIIFQVLYIRDVG